MLMCLYCADEDVLTLKSLRDKLQRSDSPFLPTNNSGGGFGELLSSGIE